MGDAAAGAASNPSGTNPGKTRSKRFLVLGVILVIAGAGGGYYWYANHDYEATDDAFIAASVNTLAPRVDGRVLAVRFTDNQKVNKGDLLLEIDPADYQVALDQARAALGTTQAQAVAAQADLDVTKLTVQAAIDQAKFGLDQAKQGVAQAQQQAAAADADAVRADADAKRYDALLKTSDASRQQYDLAMATARGNVARAHAADAAVLSAQTAVPQAQARLDDANAAPQRIALKEAQVAVARSQVAQAQATVAAAQLNLSYTKVMAPASGRVGKRGVQPGDLVSKGAALTNLVVDPPWVVANFKETQLSRMHVGDPVTMTVDALPGVTLQGKVDSFQPGSGAQFSLLPPENATGNYVKVVQRVPVKIVLIDVPADLLARLAPGISVEPRIHLGAGDGGAVPASGAAVSANTPGANTPGANTPNRTQ